MVKRRVRVLVADDEEHIRELISAIATSLGAEVVARAADGEEALALFEQTRPQMVILDINMPKMTGDRALARILEIEPRTLGIMMTAQDSMEAVRRCLELGARNYILKSNTAEEIYRLLGESWTAYAEEVRAAEDP